MRFRTKFVVFLVVTVAGAVALHFIPSTQYYPTEEGPEYIHKNWFPVTVAVAVAMVSATLYFFGQLLKYTRGRARCEKASISSGGDRS